MKYADFQDADGKIDWKAYNAASAEERKREVDSGRYCYSCGSYLIFGNRGYRQLCGQCESLRRDPGEVDHNKQIRCPGCNRIITVSGGEAYHLYKEGGHSVTCEQCEAEFTVETRISYTFTSPAVLPKEDDPEGDDTDD